MDKQTFEKFYDRLCVALTAYEAASESKTDPEYDEGNALYSDVVEIVNDMASAIN